MSTHSTVRDPQQTGFAGDPREDLQRLLRDLKTTDTGLSTAEARRRLIQYGPNLLTQAHRATWPAALGRQLVHPLALLLWLAAGLAWVSGTPVLALAIIAVVLLNAGLAFWQEQQAERSVEALAAYLPDQTDVLREGHLRRIDATEVVPGDVLLVQEGARIPADARLLTGAVEVDMSALTGESVPVVRLAGACDPTVRLLHAEDTVFRGTTCTSGAGRAVVFGTGTGTEIGRIASLSHGVDRPVSPLERQVRVVAWLIAGVAVAVGLAFLPLGLFAGLSLGAALTFAVGLLVANVPEGLLPTITLALAVGVKDLARSGAVVKRLSAVETLGSTGVICTDKTGTLTANRMSVEALWTPAEGRVDVAAAGPQELAARAGLATTLELCTEATLDGAGSGDPTEVALLQFARTLRGATGTAAVSGERVAVHRFDPRLRRMSTVHRVGGLLVVDTKGAPESVLGLCGPVSSEVSAAVQELAGQGLRVLALAGRVLEPGEGTTRPEVERELRFGGLVGLLDPPRDSVAPAVTLCHRAGLRIHVITGDNPLTAASVARSVGIGRPGSPVVTGEALAALTDAQLSQLLASGEEVVFARATPEDKLRIADLLSRAGEVIAMTGDGVNDAPALRRADIGVAMGRSGTDVAREAATMVLTDDDFATIVKAVQAGRQVYDNVRKFILYIFAHAVPEVVPFLVFALSGGAVPLPLTVLQILAIDLGTETLPALALGREPAEPGLMDRPPRRRGENVITGRMLARAWGILGPLSALLVMTAFFSVLLRAGWRPGDPTGAGTVLHEAYVRATTATFAGIVACQVGVAFAARTERVALARIGLGSNRLLLGGIAFELVFTAALVELTPLQGLFGTTGLDWATLALLSTFPFLVWSADELFRWAGRRRAPGGLARPARTAAAAVPGLGPSSLLSGPAPE